VTSSPRNAAPYFGDRKISGRTIEPHHIYFIPIGLLIKSGAPESFWKTIGKTPADFPNLNWSNFLIGNLVPVTIGNIIGGSIMVAAVYWFVYLRKKPP
jgi:formate transporter